MQPFILVPLFLDSKEACALASDLVLKKLHVDEAVALAFDNVRMHLVGRGYIGWP